MLDADLRTKNFYDRLNRLCVPQKIYTSFELRKSLHRVHSIGKSNAASNISNSFCPFLNERDKLGRLLPIATVPFCADDR